MKHIFALTVLTGVAFVQESGGLSQKNRIDLPNVDGWIDDFSADVKTETHLCLSLWQSHTRGDRRTGEKAHPDHHAPS
jgi:hypothetical protein